MSPTRKRVLSAHLLRDWDSEDGIAHEPVLPPTNISLASEKLKRRNMSNREDEDRALDDEKPAIDT